MQNLAHFAIKINSKLLVLKSLELAFRGSSFQNFPEGEYPRTSLHRSHLQRTYVLPPNFEFVPKPLYYELYCTDHCIKWAFKTWKYRFSVSKFKKIRKAYIPGLAHVRVCPPHFLERIVTLELVTSLMALSDLLQGCSNKSDTVMT